MKVAKLGCILYMLFLTAYAGAQGCEETRYTFDIGSGSTKLGIVKIDACKQTVLEFMGSDVEHIKFQKCLEKADAHKALDEECITAGIAGMQALLDRNNLDCRKNKCAGIATSWARNSTNVDKILAKWREMGINIKTISQESEGVFAFNSALLHPEVRKINDVEKIAVVDAGAGSFQVGTQNKNAVNIFYGKFGAFSLKKLIDANLGIKTKDGFYDSATLPKALKIAKNLVNPDMRKDANLLQKIKNDELHVFAVGRLFVNAFMQEMGFSATIYKDDLQKFAAALSGMSEIEVAKKYPKMAKFFIPHAQVSAIMVHAIMDSLGVEKIKVIDARLFDYLALDKQIWVN